MDIVDGLRLVAGAPTDRIDCFNCHSRMREAADEIERLRAELETERMRLVACSVIALANTPESAASARDMHPDYQSPYCDDVARAIDREIALRAELAECKQDAERYRWLRGTVPESSSRWARWRLECWISGAWHELRGLHLDTCIDAARKGEGE